VTGHAPRSRRRRRDRILAVAALLVASPSFADVPAPEIERATYPVNAATGEIRVDGRLDEAAWRTATRIDLAYETVPAENTPARVATTCFVTFDERHLYVAFDARDPDPSAIRAHISDRDTAFQDDFVGVVLDPFDDGRRGFEFLVNALGVQMDLFFDDVAVSESELWDAIWSSAGTIGDDGYVVEMAIPFSSLSFPRSAGAQSWGIDAFRVYPRDQRYRLASQPSRRDLNCYLCSVSRLTGLEGMTPGRNLEIVPTLVAGRTDRREDFPDGPLTTGDEDAEAGLTASWGVTPNLTLIGALNPDFSQVEADVAQLDVNTQFALLFPEKRPFFLEGADFFDTPLDLVFTRNVADPSWGLKLTGKEGRSAVGTFVARDGVTQLLVPGSQGSRATSLDIDSTVAVARYRRDVGRRSTIGALITSREGDGYENRVAGLDAKLQFDDANTFRLQAAGSRTRYPDGIAESFDQRLDTFDGHAYRASWDYDTRLWDAWARYADVGRGFRADLGFMPQVDYRLLDGGFTRTWWGEEDDAFTRIDLSGEWEQTEDQSGGRLSERTEMTFSIGLPRQTTWTAGGGQRDRVFNRVRFEEQFVWTELKTRPSGSLFASLYVRSGDQIDFANTRSGDELVIEPAIETRLGRHVTANLSHSYQTLRVDGGRLFTAHLSQLRFVYQFNPRAFARAIVQYADIERDPELYLGEVEARQESLFTQLLFSYKLNPQTVLFVGTSDNALGTDSIELRDESRSYFFKIGYAWNL